MHSKEKNRLSITDIKLRIVESGTDGLLAWASCVISGSIKIDNIAIRKSQRDGALFLTFPTKQSPNGDRYHYFNPISANAAQALQDAILTRLADLARLSSPPETKGTQTP